MNNGWQYTNHKFPISTLFLETNDDILLLIKTFGGEHCRFNSNCCEATTGTSGIGCWEEGDIDFIDEDGKLCTFSYDYMPVDDTWVIGRVFRYVINDKYADE